ncbi:glycine-rich domain-containing protein [Kribbella sp. CA-293567]|uniref:glycine-rich domain-containing protein n=1 Tax=Kribbella sp. CA-293567 TaxID=3002436 RepID=UPI0022DD710F|nr:hypothetical protein [Kribbella sp. CA-293567]WBQ03029.1 hypothetical protein OX958_23965 [Kribbella sp. CA-293567]
MGEPFWITYEAGAAGPELTAGELRQIEAAFFEGPGGGRVFSGVKYGTGLVSLAGTTITHQALNFVIQGLTTTTGAYVGYEPQATKTLQAAHATLARVDRVWVEVQDHEVDASNQRRSIVVYAPGAPGGAAATVPTTAVLMAEINVPINNTLGATVTDKRTYYNPPPKIDRFNADGTWNEPAGCKWFKVRVQAGGGGGGGCLGVAGTAHGEGGGGGGGGYTEKIYPAGALGASVAVTVGAGGIGGTPSSSKGADGGASSVGGLTANGGIGGSQGTVGAGNTAASGGAGGTATGGDLNVSGSDGGQGRVLSGVSALHGWGGASYLGGSAQARTAIGAGNSGKQYGGGGSGAFVTTANQSGGPAADGVVIFEAHFR